MAAESGHGTTLAMEVSAPGGTMTAIAQITSEIPWPELSRPMSETTAHSETIYRGIPSGRIQTGPITFSGNWIKADTTHDHLTGLYEAFINNEKRGYRLRGPSGSTGVDEWIFSAYITNIGKSSPNLEGGRTFSATLQMDGVFILDGVTVGT